MRIKKLISTVLLVSTLVMAGCGNAAQPQEANVDEGTAQTGEAVTESGAAEEEAVQGKVTILYTNDIHTYINNVEEDDEGNVTTLMTYGKVAAMKQELLDAGESVILVDAGDHSQGTAFGGMNEGSAIIDIMNKAGYDLATLGNHEFDYGMFRAMENIDKAEYPYISCSFVNASDRTPVLEGTKIIETEQGIKVGFVGISTPESITKSTPVYFQDEKGNYIYDFLGGEDGQELYDAVQANIDSIKEEVDYVIALGHLGVDQSSAPFRSTDVIANTTGLDAFIDGHSHTETPGEEVADKEGNTVILTQTGNYLNNVGKMTISDGTISTELVSEYENSIALVDEANQAVIDDVQGKLGEVIAKTDNKFSIMNPDNPEERIIRRMETSLGDLVADSVYYYFNEIEQLPVDLAIVNGGGIRADIEAGEISYETAKQVQPFGNVVCEVEATGQEILDMLEWTSKILGQQDEEGNPAEAGGFIHIAGAKYTVDTTIESTATGDDNDMFISAPTGDYRVQDVEIFNKETGAYEAIDLNKTYRIAGINYLLRNGGNGLSMLQDNVLVKDYIGEDYMIFSEYLKAFARDGELPLVNSANSPLSSLEGYLIDYENPMGAGRITIK